MCFPKNPRPIWDNPVVKPAIVMPTPLTPEDHSPERTMTRAVIVQMIRVSTIGPTDATRPSLMGYFVLAAAWAMAADPCPASLENKPRYTPHLRARKNEEPANPPVIAVPVNAS